MSPIYFLIMLLSLPFELLDYILIAVLSQYSVLSSVSLSESMSIHFSPSNGFYFPGSFCAR